MEQVRTEFKNRIFKFKPAAPVDEVVIKADPETVKNFGGKQLRVIWAEAAVNNIVNTRTQGEMRDQFNCLGEIFPEDCVPARNFVCCSTVELAVNEVKKSQKCVIIVEGRFGQDLLAQVHQLKSVFGVTVKCGSKTIGQNRQWASKFNKVGKVTSDAEKLISETIINLERAHENFYTEHFVETKK